MEGAESSSRSSSGGDAGASEGGLRTKGAKRSVCEYRITLPYHMADIEIGLLYMVARSSTEDSKGGDGVEILKNEPYERGDERGQFTDKLYHLDSFIPSAVSWLFPKKALRLREVCYNAFPHIETTYAHGTLSSFYMCVETRILDGDRGDCENALGLSRFDLARRKVVKLDLVGSAMRDKKKFYESQYDPANVAPFRKAPVPCLAQAAKGGDWRQTVEPVCTVYKCVTCEIKIHGLSKKITNFAVRKFHDAFLRYHRRLYAWSDEWWGMTEADVREMERRTREELEARKAAKKAKKGKGKDKPKSKPSSPPSE